ncbi:type IV pilus twitching motility protein PilT [Laceyella sacchari]|uniref:PilT/PilU family type 4a pilus ATPase n=1 Tax=Laceyella sacchari TaxID=37482 RepID=A0ABY5U4V5_LACSH|nr:PilT/PilU family type 4a pilus ATPase [Laceyella sacchari]TCW41073.1 twitching motility protein PilT [Laceyella sacchari]UWE04666.1 PilT/PilU family type 4a pilus ATPase [Laceyella sacchari]
MQITDWISLAIVNEASDLHLVEGEPPRVRIQGKMELLAEEQVEGKMIWAFLAAHKKVIRDRELDFAFQFDEIRLRVHAYRLQTGVGLAIRLFPRDIPSPEELRLPEALLNLSQKKQGILLVTGPTGSGKSTTLAALLELKNRTSSSLIITLEDPIEYTHRSQQSLVIQRQIGLDTASYQSGVQAALRQDPDVLMIGELREPEAVRAALYAAEAGRLVMATMHAARAAQAIQRIIHQFPAEEQTLIRTQLSMSLLGIAAQRLFPGNGYNNRIAAFEVLINTRAVQHLIRAEQIHQVDSIMQAGQQAGMQTMDMAVQALLKSKEVEHAAVKEEWLLPHG